MNVNAIKNVLIPTILAHSFVQYALGSSLDIPLNTPAGQVAEIAGVSSLYSLPGIIQYFHLPVYFVFSSCVFIVPIKDH